MYHVARTETPLGSGFPVDEKIAWAINTADLPKLAYLRALKGAKWLDKHAPADWRLHMLSIFEGKVSSHVKMQYDTENPAALAFRRCSKLRRTDGRVTWRDVADVFFAGSTGIENAQQLGLLEMSHQVGNVTVYAHTDATLLNEAWAKVLTNLEWHEHTQPYPDPLPEHTL